MKKILLPLICILLLAGNCNAGLIKHLYREETADGNGHQGVTSDGTYYYAIDTTIVRKYQISNFSLISSTSSILTSITGTVNHLGGGTNYNGKLYLSVDQWSSCGTNSNQRIVVIDTSDMSYVEDFDASANSNDAIAGVATDGSILYTISYCDGTTIWMWDITDGTALGTITLSRETTGAQGIAYNPLFNTFFISEKPSAKVISQYAYDGTYIGESYTTSDSGDIEGLDYVNGGLVMTFDYGAKEAIQLFNTVEVIYSGVTVD